MLTKCVLIINRKVKTEDINCCLCNCLPNGNLEVQAQCGLHPVPVSHKASIHHYCIFLGGEQTIVKYLPGAQSVLLAFTYSS